jgi:hypothetical protein
MKSLSTLLLASVLLGGCTTHEYVFGTTSYTSTPPSATTTGAGAETALLCASDRGNQNLLYVQLGGGCTLRAAVWGGGRGAPASLAITPLGECRVTGSNGPFVLDVKTATGTLAVGSFDLTLGGTSRADARYVTYRFTGPRGTTDAGQACDALRSTYDSPSNGAPVDPPWQTFESRRVGT